jgi:hypothetical protein
MEVTQLDPDKVEFVETEESRKFQKLSKQDFPSILSLDVRHS